MRYGDSVLFCQWIRGVCSTVLALVLIMVINTVVNAVASAASQVHEHKVLLKDSLLVKPISLESYQWRFHRGDNPQWANPTFNDSSWSSCSSVEELQTLGREGWTGIGWYRIRVHVDSALYGVPMALTIVHRGASEIFFDGQRIGGYGKPSENSLEEFAMLPVREATFFTIARCPELPVHEHILAVRYSDTKAWLRFERFFAQRSNVGFGIRIGSAKVIAQDINAGQAWLQIQALMVGALGGLTVLHLLLFALTRKTETATTAASRGQRHIQYSMFTGFLALYFGVRVATESYSWENVEAFLWLRSYHSYALVTAFISCVALFYVILYERFPKRLIWVWSFMPFVVFWGAAWFGMEGEQVFFVFAGVIFLEILRIIILSLLRKRPNAWILGTGGLMFMTLLVLQILVDRRILTYTIFDTPWLMLGSMMSIPLAMSVYLARQIAENNRELQTKLHKVEELTAKMIEQEVQRQVLETDNTRKTQELEEARKLQLSMLPQNMPLIAGLDIAMFMQTATEVGGDYYDYCIDSDGTLTLAIGDATGHGVKAGTMVAATKSLFTVLVRNMQYSTVVGMLRPISLVLRHMNLKSMFMALMVSRLRYDNGNIQGLITNAGMPPALIFRAAHQTVEELLLKSMPLGTTANFPYQERTFTLATGDVLILMSDGFPERFNEFGDILGYDVAQALCANAGGKTAQEIVGYLVRQSEHWANGVALNDDMTFVVVRCVEV